MASQATKTNRKSSIKSISKSISTKMYPNFTIGLSTSSWNKNSSDPTTPCITKYSPNNKNLSSNTWPLKMIPSQDWPWNSISAKNKSDLWIASVELSTLEWYLCPYVENQTSRKDRSEQTWLISFPEKR